ncbi:aspartate carbamoyltransferase regulatory subunit [Candidatus Bathyarchaeota archaeon]|nr:aspartate carbamoyltransferase regulatory subunit [Candidatus Bathyarchaeota archaeon]
MSDRELLVSKIENGIVIDHIYAGKAFLVLKLLKLDPMARVLIALNVNSKRLGTKDLIKIEGSYLTSREIDLIGLVSPSATLNIIENWRVKEKREIKPPEKIEGIFKCPNPLCKSNSKYTPLKAVYTVEISEDIRSSKLHCNLCGSITYYGSVLEQINREDFTMEGGGLGLEREDREGFPRPPSQKGCAPTLPYSEEPFHT